jgi:hypothetical protein
LPLAYWDCDSVPVAVCCIVSIVIAMVFAKGSICSLPQVRSGQIYFSATIWGHESRVLYWTMRTARARVPSDRPLCAPETKLGSECVNTVYVSEGLLCGDGHRKRQSCVSDDTSNRTGRMDSSWCRFSGVEPEWPSLRVWFARVPLSERPRMLIYPSARKDSPLSRQARSSPKTLIMIDVLESRIMAAAVSALPVPNSESEGPPAGRSVDPPTEAGRPKAQV